MIFVALLLSLNELEYDLTTSFLAHAEVIDIIIIKNTINITSRLSITKVISPQYFICLTKHKRQRFLF